jgi:hypothetical protein
VAELRNIEKQTSLILASNGSCSSILGTDETSAALGLSSEANLMIRVTTAKRCYTSPILHEDWRAKRKRTPRTNAIHYVDLHAPVMLLCSEWELYIFAHVSFQGLFHSWANLQMLQTQ